MGGAVGLALADIAGPRLQSLVISNAAARFGARDFWRSRISQVVDGGVAAIATATVARWVRDATVRQQPDLHPWLIDMLCRTSIAGYQDCASAVMDFEGSTLLARIRTPTLVISGTEDKATPPDLGRELHQGIGGAQFVEIDASHLANVDAPEIFSRAVAAFHATLPGLSVQEEF